MEGAANLTALAMEEASKQPHQAAGALAAVDIAIEPGFPDVQPPAIPAAKITAAGIASCSTCLSYHSNLCAALNKWLATDGEPRAALLGSTVHTVPARRTICHAKEWSEYVTVVCEGWATSSTALPDGRRQIHSILLPGDLILSTGPFNPVFGHSVEAVTAVTCRRYRRSELEALVLTNPDVFKRLTTMWSEARTQANQLALSLGRRTAHERIACFILMLAEGLARRGMLADDVMEFPLRLKHIADATGLTPVHVSKVQTEFQRNGLIEIKDRSLAILDRAELRHIAGPQ